HARPGEAEAHAAGDYLSDDDPLPLPRRQDPRWGTTPHIEQGLRQEKCAGGFRKDWPEAGVACSASKASAGATIRGTPSTSFPKKDQARLIPRTPWNTGTERPEE